MKKFSVFHLIFLFVGDCTVKAKEKEKAFGEERLVLFQIY